MKKEVLEQILNSGLFSVVSENSYSESHFAWSGCDYCIARTGKRLGNDVYNCKGYTSLESAREDDFYEFSLCHGCLCAIANGEPFPEELA